MSKPGFVLRIVSGRGASRSGADDDGLSARYRVYETYGYFSGEI